MAHLLAKQREPLTNGELIKLCFFVVAKEMCSEKINLLKTISLLATIIALRIDPSPTHCNE